MTNIIVPEWIVWLWVITTITNTCICIIETVVKMTFTSKQHDKEMKYWDNVIARQEMEFKRLDKIYNI